MVNELKMLKNLIFNIFESRIPWFSCWGSLLTSFGWDMLRINWALVWMRIWGLTSFGLFKSTD